MSKFRIVHPLYKAYYNISQRCNNPKATQYKDYGGRGIKLCPEWNTSDKFIAWGLANGWKRGLTVERIHNDKDYSPDNVKFTTYKVQSRNTSRNKLVTAFGETKCLITWMEDSRCTKMSYIGLLQRLNRGWPPEKALTHPRQGN